LAPRGGTLPDDVWRVRHRYILILLWLHGPALFVFALVRGFGFTHALVDAGLIAIPASIAQLAASRRRSLSTITASVGLMTASAVLVHLSGGVIEAHFHFFVMVGVVVLYQEWVAYFVAIAFVVVHHAVMGSLYPTLVFDHHAAQEQPLKWAAIHGVGILAMSLAGLANWKINEHDRDQLASLNALLEATLESTADGILVTDLNGRITGSNTRFTDLYALPPSLLAAGHDDVVVAYVADQLVDSDDFVRNARALYADPEAESHEMLVFKDGRHVERSSKPQWVDGAIVGRVWTFHDVTKRIDLENKLNEALRKALESSQLKSSFLATMSHEIRTPLNGIIGLSSLLLTTEMDDTQRQYVDGVHVSSEALLRIVNDVLDFSKIEAGKLDLEAVDFDVMTAVNEVVGLVGESARRKELVVATESHVGNSTCLRGDVGRLRQIMLNLLTNAVKFTDAGTVTLRVACGEVVTEPSLTSTTVVLHVDVADTGVGIDDADQARLFDPFTQVDASTTRRYGGTGLGLAICARLAREMGGTIALSSRVGEGSTFSVDIPFALGSEANAAPRNSAALLSAPIPGGDPAGGCLLIAEDNVVNQLVVKQMVRRLGYECDVVANGVEALAALELRTYVAVLMDCYMPEMDGFAATAELRGREGDHTHTPIIALTASAMAEDREHCVAAGMDDFLTKPINIELLAAALNRWVKAPAI
jgi:signal transduction histidine kinase/CheY-like chemotaxis protein